MDETPVSLGSKAFCRDATLIEEHAAAVYGSRPMLYSVRNTTRLSTESSRARRAAPLEGLAPQPPPPPPSPPVRDFTAYFQGSPGCDPNYSASHTVPELDIKNRVIPTYPVGQSLRWYPYVETSSIEDVSCVEKESKTCRCTKCTSKKCTAKTSSSSTLKSCSGRNNIMKFADIYTMTPRLIDTACGSCIVTTVRQSDISGTGSDIAVRDSRNGQRSQSNTKCSPTPILKSSPRRRRRLCDYNDIYGTDSYCEDYEQQRRYDSGQDVYDDEPSRTSSRFSLFGRHRRDEPTEVCSREMIYDEGITDRIRRFCRLPPACPQEMKPYSPPCERNKWRVRCCPEENDPIPHSHRHNSSRYHRNCKHSRSKVFILDNDMCRLIPSSPRIHHRRGACPPPVEHQCPTCIKLPRKVLTSEANMEHFVDPRWYPTTTCGRRNF